ncbi:ABC transporter substrate-binding protein [Solicola sp. PLA-1-18]|uniref:taurine ABC transporter substrate-binding protein n=1 Tax=Solicola sp. PLA-1-18 TaxID=3380532 RepID=UPI003B7ED0FB
MPRHTRRLTATAALLTVVATALSACGNGAASQATGSDDKVIRIAYQKFPSGDLVVKQRGLLEKALPDYDVQWKAFDSGASINTAFVGKAVDVAAIGSSPVARGLSEPLNIPYKVAFVLDVAGDNEALVARKDTGITDVAGLKGKKIATSFSSTAHYSLLAALDQAGLKDSDVDLIDLEPQDILAAWTRGDIDAAYTWLPTLDELRKDGTTLIASRQLATAGKPTLDLGVVSDSFVDNHPDAVDAWRKAEAEALREIESDPGAAAKDVSAELGVTPAVAADQLKQGVFLTPEQVASTEWLGSEGAPGNVAQNLHDGAKFLESQNQIPSVPDLSVFQKALYVKGLPGALDQ